MKFLRLLGFLYSLTLSENTCTQVGFIRGMNEESQVLYIYIYIIYIYNYYIYIYNIYIYTTTILFLVHTQKID